MSTISDLQGLSSAEDFFHYLKLPYEAAALSPNRLHILKLMGQYLKKADLSGSDESIWQAARDTLEAAYADILAKGPLGARVMQVLKDHDPARRLEAQGKGFFAFDDLFDPA